MPHLRLAVAVCAGLLLLPAAARAEGFGLPVDLSEPQTSKTIVDSNGDDPGTLCWKPGAAGVDVAVNQAGDAVAAWFRRGEDDVIRVQAAYRFRGGAFGPAQTIGTARRCHASDLGRLDAGIEDSGDALVTWPGRNETSGEPFIQAAELVPDDSWSQPLDLAPGGAAPRLAMSPSGHAVIAFDRSIMGKRSVEALLRGPTGDFGAPRPLSDPESTPFLRSVAINDEGAAVVGWEDIGPPGGSGSDSAVVAVRPADGEFTTQRRVSEPAERIFGPSVTIGPEGRVTTVFQRRDGTRSEVPELRLLRPDGTLEEDTEPLPVMSELAFGAGVVTDDSGAALAYWTECSDETLSYCGLGYSARRFGTPLSPPEYVGAGRGALHAGPGGEIAASERIGGELRLSRRLDSGFEEPQAVRFGPGEVGELEVAVAVGGDGVPLVGWASETEDELERVRVSTWDTEPPSLEVSVPATATPGQAVTMSATAADPTGTSVAWDFGDGGTAGGSETSHAYAAPGRYTVTVTATDGARNPRTTTRVIDVATPAPPPSNGGDGGNGGQSGGSPTPPGPIVEPVPRSTGARVLARFTRRGRYTRIRRLAVVDLPAGAAVEVRCRGRRCPFSTRRWASTPSGWRNARRAFGRRTTLPAGTVIELRVTAAGRIGQVVRYTLRRTRKPRVSLSTP